MERPSILQRRKFSTECLKPIDSFTPSSFDEARTWVDNHYPTIKALTHMLKRYPQLVNDEALGGLGAVLAPLIDGYLDNKMQRSFSWTEPPSRVRRYSSLNRLGVVPLHKKLPKVASSPATQSTVKTVYFCCQNMRDASLEDVTIVKKVVNSLVPFCYVRSKSFHNVPFLPGSKFKSEDIHGTHVFLFFLNHTTLADQTCVRLLVSAIKQRIPVIYIRSPVFRMDTRLPSFISHITLDTTLLVNTRIPEANSLFTVPGMATPRSVSPNVTHSSLNLGTVDSQEGSILNVESKNKISHDTSHAFDSDGCPTEHQSSTHKTLLEILSDAMHDAMTYVPSFHDACINKLYRTLENLLQSPFPGAGLLRLHAIEQAKVAINDRANENHLTIPSVSYPLDDIRSSDRLEVMSEYQPRTPEPRLFPDRPLSNIGHSNRADGRASMKRDYDRSSSGRRKDVVDLVVYGQDKWSRKSKMQIPALTFTVFDSSPESSETLSPELRSPNYKYRPIDGGFNDDTEDLVSRDSNSPLASDDMVHNLLPTSDTDTLFVPTTCEDITVPSDVPSDVPSGVQVPTSNVHNIEEERRTSYLLFKNKGDKPRRVHWPPEVDEEMTSPISINSSDEDEDSNIPVGATFSDIDIFSDTSN